MNVGIILVLIIVLYFCYFTVKYIRKRRLIRETIQNSIMRESKMDHEEERGEASDFPDLNSYINENSGKIVRFINDEEEEERIPDEKDPAQMETWCKELVLEIADTQDQSDDICEKLGGRLCQTVDLKRVDIPPSTKATFLTSNGTQLLPGHSYCLYKQPPVSQSSYECDEKWGFWVFSHKYERWMCESLVSGIYNAKTNAFNDPCQHGNLLFDNEMITRDSVKDRFNPQDFYSTQFQERFSCRCEKGYIFDPKKSRTKCIRDPCLLGLPRHAAARGYNPETEECECGEFFFNIDGNETFPCTSCPSNNPHFDPSTNILTVYLRCKKKGETQGALLPCRTEEENLLGCIKATLKVKPMNQEGTFEDRIFF